MSIVRAPIMTRARRGIIGLLVATALIGVTTVVVRASYGFFSSDYEISGIFPRAGTGLRQGSDVQFHGVAIGKVQRIELAGPNAKVVLKVKHDVKIPVDAHASIEPKTLFGDDFVKITYPPASAHGPFIPHGGHLRPGDIGTEVQDLVAGLSPLANHIDIEDVGSFLHELAKTVRNHGREFGRSLDLGTQATDVLEASLNDQIASLDAIDRILATVHDLGPKFASIIDSANQALPMFAQARQLYEQAVANLRPLAENLARFVEVNTPSIERIFATGGNLVRVLITRHQDIGTTIHGLYEFLLTISRLGSADRTPSGAGLAYAKVIINTKNLMKNLCLVLANPPLPGMGSILGPVLGPLLNNVAQGTPECAGTPSATAATTATPAANANASSPASGSAPNGGLSADQRQALSNVIDSMLAAPTGAPQGLGSVLRQLLGQAP